MFENLISGLKTTLFGFGITFIALSLLIAIIKIVDKILNVYKNVENKSCFREKEDVENDISEKEIEDEELVAVITAAIASSLNRKSHGIIVRKLKRIPYRTPSWNIAGRSEQISTKL